LSVSIVRGKEIPKVVSEAINLLGGVDRFFDPRDFIFIKPNVCGGVPGKVGTATNVKIISAIVSLLKGKVARVAVGDADSSMYKADRMLKDTGIVNCAEGLGIEVVNLSQGEMVEVEVQDGYVLDSIKVNRTLSEATKIISAPVARTHATTEVTLNLKNMFGILPERKKAKFHPKIDTMLVDITKTFPPVLCVIDATTALEGFGPFHGKPKKLNFVVAGNNAVATDTVMTNIMGFNPRKIKHLRLASEKGLGPINLEEIEIVGDRIENVKNEFEKAWKEPFTRYLGRIPGFGHLFMHYAYESAVEAHKINAWQKKRSKKDNQI
jgi:uncharacterized protein (DUF362 family)